MNLIEKLRKVKNPLKLATGALLASLAGTNFTDPLPIQPSLETRVSGYPVLERNFSQEVQKKLKDVRVESADSDSLGASGRAGWGGTIGFIGWAPRIRYLNGMKPREKELTMIHEYLHQCDYRGMINHTDFLKAYHKMRKDPRYRWLIVGNIEVHPWNQYVKYEKFPIIRDMSRHRERIAGMGTHLRFHPDTVPSYMKKVFSKVLSNAPATPKLPDKIEPRYELEHIAYKSWLHGYKIGKGQRRLNIAGNDITVRRYVHPEKSIERVEIPKVSPKGEIIGVKSTYNITHGKDSIEFKVVSISSPSGELLVTDDKIDPQYMLKLDSIYRQLVE